MREGNYTRVPNAYFDRIPRCTSPSEFLCLGLIIRRTAGFGRDEAEISVEQFERATGLKERIVYQAIKGLEAKNLIPARGAKPGMKSSFRVNYSGFDKVPELAPRQTVQKKRDADGAAIAPRIVPAICPACGPVELSCPQCGGPVELVDENGLARVEVKEALHDQQVIDSTRPPVCRGSGAAEDSATPAPDCRGSGAKRISGEVANGAGTPAINCRGREELETYLVGWIGRLCAPPPAGLVDEVAAILGASELRWFTERCTIRSEWLQKRGWGGMYYMARDAVKAAQEWRTANVRPISATPSSAREVAAGYSLDDARWLIERDDCQAELRAALREKFPELTGGLS